jgi:phosphoribosyl 1,2-cyclic phosphate phosphodiesterase
LADDHELVINNATVKLIPLAVGFVYAFLFEEAGTRVLVVADEHIGWQPGRDIDALDLAILPMGLPERHPLTGEQLVPADHPMLKTETTFTETIALIRRLPGKKVMLTDIEEPWELSYDDLRQVEVMLQERGLPVSFAFDTQIVEP